MDQFRDFVQGWLDKRGWSQARLAEETGLNQSMVSKYLATDPRKRIRPTPASLEKMVPVLGVPYLELLSRCGYLPRELTQPLTEELERDVLQRMVTYLAAVRRSAIPECDRNAWVHSWFDRSELELEVFDSFITRSKLPPRTNHHGADHEDPRGPAPTPRRRLRPSREPVLA